MTQEQAQKLGSYVLDAGLDATIIPIERGDEYMVRITQPQWHCWTFDDWTLFCKEGKKQRNKQRKAADRFQAGISPDEVYRLALFA